MAQLINNPRNSINAAFDSVNLINEIIISTAHTIENKIQIITDNKKHLEIMMSKKWFVNDLINNEGYQIQTEIINAENFLNLNNG